MATTSPYLERARAQLWERDMFSFIPDRDLPPPDGTVESGDGPAVIFAGFPRRSTLDLAKDCRRPRAKLVSRCAAHELAQQGRHRRRLSDQRTIAYREVGTDNAVVAVDYGSAQRATLSGP